MARITVEDCLEFERNRFSLVLLASRRAKALLNGRPAVTDTKGNKSVVTSLREIADGKVRFKYPIEASSNLAIPSERGLSAEEASISLESGADAVSLDSSVTVGDEAKLNEESAAETETH